MILSRELYARVCTTYSNDDGRGLGQKPGSKGGRGAARYRQTDREVARSSQIDRSHPVTSPAYLNEWPLSPWRHQCYDSGGRRT